MSTVGEIESALRALPVQDARAVAHWLQEYLDQKWDKQMDADIATGRLDKLAEQALDRYRAGQVKPLDEVIDHS
ncbi:MAG: hypothetical protein ABSH15_15465 [Verrucomicrobiota bacterium]|jgi:hypothetical protein